MTFVAYMLPPHFFIEPFCSSPRSERVTHDSELGVQINTRLTIFPQHVVKRSILELAAAVHRISLSSFVWLVVQSGISVERICSFEAKIWVCRLTIFEHVEVIRPAVYELRKIQMCTPPYISCKSLSIEISPVI